MMEFTILIMAIIMLVSMVMVKLQPKSSRRREWRDKIHSFASSNGTEGVRRLVKRLLVVNLKK